MADAWTIERVESMLRDGHSCTSKNEVWNRLFLYEVGREGSAIVVRWTELVDGKAARHGTIYSGRDLEFAARTFLQHAGEVVSVIRRDPVSAQVRRFPSLAMHPAGPPMLNGKGAHR